MDQPTAETKPIDQETLQQDLLEVFKRHGVSVGVGLTREGVAIRSQDDRVDAVNLGIVEPFAD